MSVLDRQQTTPDAPPPSTGGSSRGVPWVGVLTGLMAVGLVVVGGYLLWPEAQAAPERVPSPEISIPETYPEAPEAKTLEDAKAGYAAYEKVASQLGPDGRVKTDLTDMKEVTTGKAYGYEKAEAKASKNNRFVFGGEPAEATIKSARFGKDSTVILRVCIDQSKRTAVNKKGEKVKLPKWISSKATMKQVGGTWKMADRDDVEELKSCV